MNTVKHSSQNSLKNIDWKLFFNMRIFRYAFLKQLKSISTYIFFCLTIIAGGLLLWLSFSLSTWFMGDLDDLDVERLKEVVKIPVGFYKFFLYLLFMVIFTLFITFKSLQIFRDEMDDGTLLIFSSMSFSRLKLITQKWLSLQAVCLMFTLTVIFISPMIFLLIQGFSTSAWQTTTVWYKNSISLIIASIIFQVLISTIAILISLYFGKTGTIGFLSLFSALSIVMFYIPGIIELSILKGSSREMYSKIETLGKKSDQANLFHFYKDPDLKEFFEMENWYVNQKADKEDNEYWAEIPIHNQFEFTFDPEVITELHDVLTSNVEQKKQAFLTKKINVTIATTASASKITKQLFELFNKTTPTSISLQPVRCKANSRYGWRGIENLKIDKTDKKLIKSKEIYKTALDNINNLTPKEKKIVQLSKSLFDDPAKANMKNEKFVQIFQDTLMFRKSLKKQYDNHYHTYMGDQQMDDLLENKNGSKSVAYFVDNSAFQNISFLMNTLLYEILQHMYQLSDRRYGDVINDKKYLEKYLSFIKANNYLNIMTQIGFIWNGEIDEQLSLSKNYYGEWEKKESSYTKHDGTSAKIEFLKIKPETFKKIINPTYLYIIYPLISLSLVGLLIFIVYKKDFV